MFGYLIVRNLSSKEEMDRVVKGFEWSIQHCGDGSDHNGSNRTMFGGPIEHTPEMCALLDHPGVLNLISGILGDDFNYCSGDGNYYVGDTHWHPDGNWGQLWATKTAFSWTNYEQRRAACGVFQEAITRIISFAKRL